MDWGHVVLTDQAARRVSRDKDPAKMDFNTVVGKYVD